MLVSLLLPPARAADLPDTGAPGLGDEGVELAGGTFRMGPPGSEPGGTPRRVRLDPFQMARTEVSQSLWASVMARDPSAVAFGRTSLLGADLPVQNLDWCEAVDFANRLSAKHDLSAAYSGVAECASTAGDSVQMDRTASGWRLPTEAEWEYAARAGTIGLWGTVTTAERVCTIGDVDDRSARRFGEHRGSFRCRDRHAGPAPLGSYAPNAWGLYDLIGNVGEWVWDGYGDYGATPVANPTGPAAAPDRVVRGGSWESGPTETRVADRSLMRLDDRRQSVGLRLVRAPARIAPMPGIVVEAGADGSTWQRIDADLDGHPEVANRYAPPGVLSRREEDTNGDGRVDRTHDFDEQGRRTRVEADLDLDGRFDLEERYLEGEIYERRLDVDQDGNVDEVEHYSSGARVSTEAVHP